MVMTNTGALSLAQALEQEKAGSFKPFPFWGHRGTGVGPWVLSQWWPCSFQLGRYTFSSAEQAMMAGKAKLFHDEQTLERILATSDPKEVKALGRQVKNFDENLWVANRENIVFVNNMAKFSQNPAFADFLKNVEGTLIEASPYDALWGVRLKPDDPRVATPSRWEGLNLLGFALTRLSQEL